MRGGVGVAFATGSFGGLEFGCGGNHGIPRELPNSRTPGSGSNGRGAGADAAVDLRSIDWGPHLSGLEWGQTPFEAGKHWVKRGLPPPIKAAEGEV